MIIAVHALLYTRQAEIARTFFRDTLKLKSVDAGGGWPIFALPPTELAVHPSDGEQAPELYLVCDDVDRTVEELRAKGVEILRPISDQGWGRVTSIRIPGNVELGLYEPRHKLAVRPLRAAAKKKRRPQRAQRKLRGRRGKR